MRLFAYKMTHDTGFAPNPFWGYLTLATCKPKIREKKRRGIGSPGSPPRSCAVTRLAMNGSFS